MPLSQTPSLAQRAAIEAARGPVLVLAGPGAGKTFCLIERIRYLIEQHAVEPARICAFTFTNKAAEEIARRLKADIGDRAAGVKGGTIHAFCAELLREFGGDVGLRPGFGIADEDYQLGILRRLFIPQRWQARLLRRFSAHRLGGDTLHLNDIAALERYERLLSKRNKVDFDMLVAKAAQLMMIDGAAAGDVRSRWDCVLVDEFQDLNRTEYTVVRELMRVHRNCFVVGDPDQSIYSWAGADPRIFVEFRQDFPEAAVIHLKDNRRSPREVFVLARRLVTANPTLFLERVDARADRNSGFPVDVVTFENIEDEMSWIIDDLRRDRQAHVLSWGDVALLYRTHEIGDAAEAILLTAGIPCRMAQGRALAEDPVVAYVIAAIRVIANPRDDVYVEDFFRAVLPKTLTSTARAKAEEGRRRLLSELAAMARGLPREHEDGRKIRRGLAAVRNLRALASRQTRLATLVMELLSQRVGEYRSILEEHHEDLSDPASNPEVVALVERLRVALRLGRPVWIGRHRGVDIALKGILLAIGFDHVDLGGVPRGAAEILSDEDVRSLGLPLGLFKAAQLISSGEFTNTFRDFTAVDLETTSRDTSTAEIVEIAAVRVRDGVVVGEFHRLVRPQSAIDPSALAKHGLDAATLQDELPFESIWPEFRAFCGTDVLVAHNGYQFDFPILRRLTKELGLDGDAELCTYDTLPLARELSAGSAKLEDLARLFGVITARSHRALDDARALAQVFLALGEAKVVRARKTSLVGALDYLGVALALSDPNTLCEEARLFRRVTPLYTLGRYSQALDDYRHEWAVAHDPSLPTIQELIDRLGGEAFLLKVRAERTAEQRYPAATTRLRRLLADSGHGSLGAQIEAFLEKVVLSSWDGADVDRERVNLLTLHATKGLEFSRVYIIGVEDEALIGGTPARPATNQDIEEARRLLYVGMTRATDRLVLTRVVSRNGKSTGGFRFLEEMDLVPKRIDDTTR